MRVLIVEDGDQRGVLAAVRALGRVGWVVGVGSPRRGLSSRSRHTSRWHRVASPSTGIGTFVDGVNRAVAEGGYEIVFGGGDAEALSLSASRDQIRAQVALAPHAAVIEAIDKTTLAAAAERAGLATPRVWDGAGEGKGEAGSPVVVVKERTHGQLSGAGTAPHFRPAVVQGAEEIGRLVAEIRSGGGEAVVQERIPGRLMAWVAVTDAEGRVVASMQQRSDAIWPPGAGVSVRAEVVEPDLELDRRAGLLLADLGWFGIVELQFLVPEHGPKRLIDFTGRFYGSLALAPAAGLNLPAAWAALATGRPLPSLGPPTPGVRYHWLEGDLRRALRERRGGVVRDVVTSLRYARGATHSIGSTDDPWPLARFSLALAGRGAAKALASGLRGREVARPRPGTTFEVVAADATVVAAWDELAGRLGATPFASPSWVLPWWAAFGGGALSVAVVRRGGEMVGVLPHVTRRHTLRLPTNSETPLFDPVVVDEEAAADLVRRLVASGHQRLVLSVLDADAPARRGFEAALTGARWPVVRRTVLRSPYLTIDGPWATYETALAGGRRRELRRRRRRLEAAEGPVAVEVHDGSADLDPLLAEGLRV